MASSEEVNFLSEWEYEEESGILDTEGEETETDLKSKESLLNMASSDEVSLVSEWEYDEESGILDTEGEEVYRPLTKNEKAWNSCEKLKADVNFHQRYISIKDALCFKDLSSEEKETFMKDKGLAFEDKMFLSSEKAVKCLEKISDAVVCIVVKQSVSSQAYGTGFLVQVNNEAVVITNSHSLRSPNSGKGIDFSMVEPGNVRVISFYNGMGNAQITHEVARIGKASPPDKNKANNVLLESMEEAILGDGTRNSQTMRNCYYSLGFLTSYFDTKDAFLDYALLYLKPLQNEEQRAKFAMIKPLEIKVFDIFDIILSDSSTEIQFNGLISEYPHCPQWIRLFSISHPHRASQKVSFGGLELDIHHLECLRSIDGQNDSELLEGREAFATHSIATCKGSSGAPIFFFTFNDETGEVELDEAVYFLHFYGEVEGKLCGKAVLFSTVIKSLESQDMHEQLASAFSEVREAAPRINAQCCYRHKLTKVGSIF